jgi:hypothetical protein
MTNIIDDIPQDRIQIQDFWTYKNNTIAYASAAKWLLFNISELEITVTRC